MYTFAGKDTYKISHLKKDSKFVIDYKVLVRLYAPIIGSVATTLYLVLESEATLINKLKVNNNINRLLKILQVNIRQFNDALNMLKEYELITYKANAKKENDFLFVIHNSKDASEFFKTKKYNESLKVMVDDSYYEQVYNYFMSFNFDDNEYIDIIDNNGTSEISEDDFYKNFFEKYPIIANATAISAKDKDELRRLKKLFNLSYDEIEKAILNSFDYVNEVMVINLTTLNNYIENKYQDKIVDKDSIIIDEFEKERSVNYFKKLSGRVNLLPSELDMISNILEKYKISEGILNVIINYYYSYAPNKTNNPFNYFIKVIESMMQKNVKSTKDAMEYFRNFNNKNYQKKDNNKTIEKKDEDKNNDSDILNEFREIMGG